MPKQTYTISNFSGGMNEGSDMLDISLAEGKQILTASDIHFDYEGRMSGISSFPTFDDHQVNVDTDINDAMQNLDRGIGDAATTDSEALIIATENVGTPTDSLSWEDGVYDFKYTVCRVLDNGETEEGPLQSFYSGGTSVNMNDDDEGRFTFTHAGHSGEHPDHMNTSDYNNKLCGRVYYSRQAGQGNATQTGWVHLCDLVLTAYNATNSVKPRAINTTVIPSNNYIDIEEPPSASIFEMNAFYPSDVGILDITSSIFTAAESKVVIGLVTYVAKSGYVYRNVPSQPDIFPTDNWLDFTQYGTSSPCTAMYGIGNMLCYFTANELVLYNVKDDAISKVMRGYGISADTKSAQMEQGVVWVTGAESSVYYYDGEKIHDLSRKRVAAPLPTAQILYNEDRRWLKIPIGSASEFYVYSFATDTWFRRTYTGGAFVKQCTLPSFTASEPGRWKKLHKVVVHGGGSSHTVALKNEQQSAIASTGTDAGNYYTEWVPDSSTKFKELFITLIDPHDDYPFRAVSVIYRPLNKF